ncbi:MAG: DUF2721 domain-containing protein [Inquilinus sp.]|nr:DUF2721 domain-containing protein [Inquilinus sp.]
MDMFSALIQPVILIPGVGLLIMSTTARFGQLEAEVGKVAGRTDPASRQLVAALMRRAGKFRLALMALYSSAAILASASLIGGVLMLVSDAGTVAVQVLTCIAVLCLFAALITLLIESRMAIEALDHLAGEGDAGE